MKPSDYSIRAVLAAVEAGSWDRIKSDERREHDRLNELAAEPLPPTRRTLIRLPGHALRDMTVAGVSGSNYLSPTSQGDYIESLTGDSAALRLGVGTYPIPKGTGSVVMPRGTAGATAYWLDSENTVITESQPSLGQVAAAPKMLAAITQVSRQLLVQGGEPAERAIRAELRRAAAAALDAAIFAGTGASGQPTGIVNLSGVGTFTGASLDVAKARNAQADLGAAKAITDPSKVAYVAAPAVAETLASRQRFTGSDRTLWEGSSFEGTLEGVRAVSSASMPASTVILGDWSAVQVAEWAGGLFLEVDPFSTFNTGLVYVRLIMHTDVFVTRPAAFTVATSVS